MQKFIIITNVLIFLLISSCSDSKKNEKNESINIKIFDEKLIKANQYLKRKEENEIEGYINRRGWQMIKTETGLRYQVYHNGNGKKIKAGNVVEISYTLSLINGKIVYDSKTDGNKTFEVGKGSVEPGLEEVAYYLKEGDKARVIIPSHLGFGILGDGNKITGKTTIIYDLEVLKVK